MPKQDPTLAYLQQRRDDAFRYDLLPSDTPENRTPVPRLCWHMGGFPPQCSDREFAEAINRSALPDAQFYLDTCFVTGREVEEALWDALLAKTVVVTPLIWRELAPWLKKPFVNRRFRDLLLEAYRVGHPGVRFEKTPAYDDALEYSVRYYVELLAFRKRVHELAAARLRKELGRDATEKELDARVQAVVQDRGHQLANKGRASAGAPNFYADEEVLVRAVLSAIVTGHETSVLTRDRDLVEQFYKLMYLIDTHYQGHLIGEAHHRQPLNFIEVPRPNGLEHLDAYYRGGELLSLPEGSNHRVLPVDFRFVMVHVYRFSPTVDNDNLTTLAFCAEREMESMLRVKGTTRGRNTDRYGLKNVHRCVSPHLQDVLGGFAAVTIDETVEVSDVAIPWVDIEIALGRQEGLRRNAIEPPGEGGGYDEDLAAARFWADLRCSERLVWMPQTKPMTVSRQRLASSIGFLPFQCRVYADQTFLDSGLSVACAETLRKVEIGITRGVYEVVSRKEAEPNRVTRQFKPDRSPGWVHVRDPANLAPEYRAAFDQYHALAAFRKQLGGVVRGQLTRSLGRAPSEAEWLAELDALHGDHQQRARDAVDHLDNPDYFLEDELVAYTVISSILEGCDCVLLTSRRVVQQQFISLVMLLDQHYRAWSLAPHHPTPLASQRIAGAEPDAELERIGFRGPVWAHGFAPSFMSRCLPTDPMDLQLQCWLVTEEDDACLFEPVAFLAERPMHAMLRVRADSGGLCTDRLEGEDLSFFWGLHNGTLAGMVERGQPTWIERGNDCFPLDPRIDVKLDRIPVKDLVAITNRCDYPAGLSKHPWPLPPSNLRRP